MSAVWVTRVTYADGRTEDVEGLYPDDQSGTFTVAVPEGVVSMGPNWRKGCDPPSLSGEFRTVNPGEETDPRTPWQRDRDHAELTGKWPESWGPFHRHFANDAVHRDGGPECDQPGTPRRVYVFDPEYLSEHEAIVTRWATEQALKPLREILPQDYEIDAEATDEEARLSEIQALLYPRE
jgi:hypothetical protein